MPRPLPDPALNYEASEVQTFFGLASVQAVEDAVARGKLPRPIRVSRQSTPLWSGKALREWMDMLPHLEEGFGTVKPGPSEKSQKKSGGELEATEG